MAEVKRKFKVKVFVSKKGNRTYALVCDLGYTEKYLTFDMQSIAEVLGVSVCELADKPVGDYAL